jgi:hypothetical protein
MESAIDNQKYKIRKILDYIILERLTYPRLRVFILTKNPIFEIKKISLLDKCETSSVAGAINETNTLISQLTI